MAYSLPELRPLRPFFIRLWRLSCFFSLDNSFFSSSLIDLRAIEITSLICVASAAVPADRASEPSAHTAYAASACVSQEP
jgi:hypothetical protein